MRLILFVTIQWSAGKLCVWAFMWMPPDRHRPLKRHCRVITSHHITSHDNFLIAVPPSSKVHPATPKQLRNGYTPLDCCLSPKLPHSFTLFSFDMYSNSASLFALYSAVYTQAKIAVVLGGAQTVRTPPTYSSAPVIVIV